MCSHYLVTHTRSALLCCASLSSQKTGNTPLHYLFAYKYDELAAYLIAKGARDDIDNVHGMTCYDGLRPENRSGENVATARN